MPLKDKSHVNENHVNWDRKLLVISDLDGTLLDHTTYTFQPAMPAIQILMKRNIPLVLCTSKTRAEIEPIRTELQNTHPFIIENGGAIYIPKGYFSHAWNHNREDETYVIIELGTPYTQIREVLKKIQSEEEERLRGFGDLTDKEVALFCDFSEGEARLAKQREYDEPFFLEDKSHLPKIEKMAAQANLQITQGGRFLHLLGKNDKGQAVVQLKNFYDVQNGPYTTIGIGDSLNDLTMLENVDYPVLVQKPGGHYDEAINLKNLMRAPGAGPDGWREAVMELLKKLGGGRSSDRDSDKQE